LSHPEIQLRCKDIHYRRFMNVQTGFEFIPHDAFGLLPAGFNFSL
jgi:hypothetical protein